MKKLILLLLFIPLVFSCSKESDKLNAIIEKYEAEREYEFKRNESVENTIKYHQAEADFAKEIIEKLEMISVDGLSETEIISRELLLFVLKHKIDSNKYKMYLNTITNENAFHLNLARMGNRTLEDKKQVLDYLKRLDSLPQRIDYNINLLRASIKEGMAQPRAVFSNYDYTYNKHIVSYSTESEFYKPFLNIPEDFDDGLKQPLIIEGKNVVLKKIFPG